MPNRTLRTPFSASRYAPALGVQGNVHEPEKDARNPACRVYGHFYHRVYERWLGPMRGERFQFLEIGFSMGSGTRTFKQYLPAAEVHSLEISCMPGWKFGNAAASAGPLYKHMRKQSLLHCGDASNVTFLNDMWRVFMRRPDAPPLKVVVDDASHVASHMLLSVFFWFPKLEPNGLLVVEDIQPVQDIQREFVRGFLHKLMMDVHYCGSANPGPEQGKDPHFPTLHPLLRGVHCELHVCVLERNDEPAQPESPLPSLDELARSTRAKYGDEVHATVI
jgi:hypothetical protein